MKKYADPEEPSTVPSGRGKLGISERTLQKYLKMFETLFLYRDQRGNVLYHTPERICRGSPWLPKITRPMTGWCRWRAGKTGLVHVQKRSAADPGRSGILPETASGEKRIHIGYLYPDDRDNQCTADPSSKVEAVSEEIPVP